jgi:hypothetical protein
MFARKSVGLVLVSMLMFGCSKSMNPVSSTPGTASVTMSVAFSDGGTQVGLMKVSNSTMTDSIRIDSAIVVFDRIKFESNIDTVKIDTNGNGEGEDNSDSSLIFRGPFIVHIHDTTAIDFANQLIPAGTYTGIKFKVHRMEPGEQGEDSYRFNNKMNPTSSDSAVTNYSLVVWGAIEKNGVWTPFEFKDNQELEFKIQGNFTVNSTTSTLNIALNFNMGSWFIDPMNGGLLDPTDMSYQNMEMIQQAIQLSFHNGRGGRDSNHDGHPDD